jgi:hypothetical protein
MSLININKIKQITKRRKNRSIPHHITNSDMIENNETTYYEHHRIRLQKMRERKNNSNSLILFFF